MRRLSIAEAASDFANLVNQVHAEGISVALEREHQVIACLTPAKPSATIAVADLNAFLRSLPSLGEDAAEFANNFRAILPDR